MSHTARASVTKTAAREARVVWLVSAQTHFTRNALWDRWETKKKKSSIHRKK